MLMDTIQDFSLNNANDAAIISSSLVGNEIRFILSSFPGDSASISYSAQAFDPGNW